MTTQPTVGALEKQKIATSAVDLASTAGAQKALGGAWPAAGLLAQAVGELAQGRGAEGRHRPDRDDELDPHPHGPGHRRQAAPVVRAERHDLEGGYVAGLTAGLRPVPSRRLMPAGGPKTIFEMENAIGVNTREVSYAAHVHQRLCERRAQATGITPTTKPADTTNG